MNEKTNELHVKMSVKMHHNFRRKCFDNNATASKKVREWIDRFLKGELL